MSIRPELDFSSIFSRCASDNNFQCFQGNRLNRLNIQRKTVEDFVKNEKSRFLPIRDLKVLFDAENRRPLWLKLLEIFDEPEKINFDELDLVLLGFGSRRIAERDKEFGPIENEKSSIYSTDRSASNDEFIYFALSLEENHVDRFPGKFVELRSIVGELTSIDAAICGQARSMIEWNKNSKFCGRCASPTRSEQGGTRRQCVQCGRSVYPRLDPVSITLVVHKDQKQILLGRKATFPKNVYSCLAGFIEHGETIEEACSREVWEESGILLDEKQTKYFRSQPWPYLGGQLMIAAQAQAVDEVVTLHDSELEDCRWFSREQLQPMIERARNPKLDRNDENLRIPPPMAIAHQMIFNWFSSTSDDSS